MVGTAETQIVVVWDLMGLDCEWMQHGFFSSISLIVWTSTFKYEEMRSSRFWLLVHIILSQLAIELCIVLFRLYATWNITRVYKGNGSISKGEENPVNNDNSWCNINRCA